MGVGRGRAEVLFWRLVGVLGMGGGASFISVSAGEEAFVAAVGVMVVDLGLMESGVISPSSRSSSSVCFSFSFSFSFSSSFSLSFSLSFSGRVVMKAMTSWERAWYASIVRKYAVKLTSLPLSAGGPSNTRTGCDGSRTLHKHAVTCETALASAPSTAITNPLVACFGLVGPGEARGGLILARTRILFGTEIDMTIASTDFAWVVPGDSRARATVCSGARVREESGGWLVGPLG